MTMSLKDAHRRTLEVYIEQEALRWTKQRQVILDVFLDSEEHLTSEELHALVAETQTGIGLATTYRTLKIFVAAGIAAERAFSKGVSRYEVRAGHHDHMICETCGRIIEFEDEQIEALQEEVAKRHGFTLVWHRLDLHGYCAECSAELEHQSV